MQIKRAIQAVPAILLTVGCFAGDVDKLLDGIAGHLKQPACNGSRQIKLQVVSDKVIHVTSFPGMLLQRYFDIIYVSKQQPGGPANQYIAGKMITYNGIAKTVWAL